MAGSLLATPANGAADWSGFVTLVMAALKGSLFVSLSNFTGTAAPEVEDGSYCDINGAQYKLTPNGSTEAIAGLTALTGAAYFYAVPSGTIVTITASLTAPAWSETKGGFYNGNNRCIGGCLAAAGVSYSRKWVIEANQFEAAKNLRVNGDNEIEGPENNILTFNENVKIATGAETAPDCLPGGITLCTNSTDNKTITLKDANITHGITDFAETDTHASMGIIGSSGGVKLIGYGENKWGGMLAGYATAADTTTSAAALGPEIIDCALKNGTGVTSFGGDANVFVVQNNSSTKFIVKGDGDIYYDGADQGAYDKENDFDLVQEAHDLQKTEKPKIREQLEKLGIIKNGFISNRKMTFLQLGTMTKIIKIIKKLGEKLGLSEEELLELAK